MDQRIIELLSIKRADAFSRYSEDHPLNIYLGIDKYGHKSMAIASKAKVIPTTSTKIMSVEYNKQTNDTKLYFSLLEDDCIDIFYKFCEDLIENTQEYSDDDKTFERILDRWNTWIYFFSKKSSMTEEKIRGLIGELFFLKYYAMPQYGENDSILAYVGPEASHKDFEFNDTWFEIKAPHKGWTSLKISSIEQLDSEKEGTLVAITLEKTTAIAGDTLTLNSLVNDCKKDLSKYNALKLDDKLRQIGYMYDEEYDKYRYIFCETTEYAVKDEFPRITKNDLPYGIINATYNISRESLTPFERIK